MRCDYHAKRAGRWKTVLLPTEEVGGVLLRHCSGPTCKLHVTTSIILPSDQSVCPTHSPTSPRELGLEAAAIVLIAANTKNALTELSCGVNMNRLKPMLIVRNRDGRLSGIR